jgi:hypothetical protein
MHLGNAAKTCSLDMQHAVWTDNRNMQHKNVAWTCIFDMQHEHAAWAGINMKHGYAART